MDIFQRIKKFSRSFTPKHRRGIKRRRLEKILRAHGISVSVTRDIAWQYFTTKPKGNDHV